MKLLAIINPNSGTKKSKEQILKALNVFSKNKYIVEVYLTQAQNDAFNYLKNNKTKYDVVCVFGGDGTMNEVVNALAEKKEKPAIGYFPSGTVNDFGSNFNLDEDWEVNAERICKGKYKEFDLGKIDNKYFDYVAAFGAMCDVPYTTKRKMKEAVGTLAYVLEGITKLPDIHPIDVKVKVNGKQYEYRALFGLVFSGGRVASTQLVSKNKSSVNDGNFNVMIVDYVGSVVPDIIAVLAEQKKHIHWFKSSEIEFEFSEKTVWTIDGEKADFNKKVKITNINKALKMLS